MPYLIDGHNLIGRVPTISLSDADDEQQLIALLRDFSTRTGQKVEVFFDRAATGHAGKRAFGRVMAHFIVAHSSADQAIRDRLDQLGKKASEWKVVSSDLAVQRSAQARRAGVVSAEEFLRLLFPPGSSGADRPDPGTLSEQEVERWIKLFGQGKSDNNSDK